VVIATTPALSGALLIRRARPPHVADPVDIPAVTEGKTPPRRLSDAGPPGGEGAHGAGLAGAYPQAGLQMHGQAEQRHYEVRVDVRKATHTAASKSITVEAAAEAWIMRVEANGVRHAVNVPIDPGHTGMSSLVRFDAQ
jgi:hypothetical protein